MDGLIQNMCSRHKQKSIEYQKAYLKKSAALECIEFRVGSAKSMPCCDTGEQSDEFLSNVIICLIQNK